MFEPKKFSDIVEDMGSHIASLSDFYVGSVTRTLVETFSYELGLLYKKMELVYLSAFIDTAEGIHLEQVVAVLDIKRGLPDYATGTVSFTRDAGKDNIIIPIGTRVSTEDGPGKPKKVYQTIEEKTLAPDVITLDVKVQAVERGEEYDAAEAEINVMPRPIPGIKSVTNHWKVRVIGKKRETDQELRERAKNTLISSGKATRLSIENTLLSMPGVTDVKVMEDYTFPQGTATLTLQAGKEKATIPRNSLILTNENKLLQTKTEMFLSGEQKQSLEVKIRSIREGRLGEIPTPSGLKFKDVELDKLVTITNPKPIVLTDFGVIDVFVAGPNLEDNKERARIQSAIDKVKAAGIYVRLDNAQAVAIDGILKIDLGTRQSLDNEELKEMETRVAETIRDFIRQIKMGNPLVFSRLLKEVITVEGVANLTDFRLFTEAERFNGQAREFQLSANKIEIEESERFEPRDICVAAGDKLLPVDVEVHIPAINKDNYKAVVEALKSYFDGLAQGDDVTNEGLIRKIENDPIKPISKTLQLNPNPWCPRSNMLILEEDSNTGKDYASSIKVSFVEKAVFGRLFAYSHFLEITGALYVDISAGLEPEEIDDILVEAKNKIDTYLEKIWDTKRFVTIKDICDQAKQASEKITKVKSDSKDFQTERTKIGENSATISTDFDGNPVITDTQVSKDPFIRIGEFQKVRLKKDSFYITNQLVSEVEVIVTNIKVNKTDGNTNDADIKNNLITTITDFINDLTTGENLNMAELLDRLNSSSKYRVTEFNVKAKSKDNRLQKSSIGDNKVIHVRSVEKVRLVSIENEEITINP